jgi:rhodanese-related sulfurtransferase
MDTAIAVGGREGATKVVGPSEVSALLRTGRVTLVDVREADEHARERIEGARLEALSRFDVERAARGVGRDGMLVFHCKGGKRSLDAAARCGALASRGITVASMEGGIEGWKAAGLGVATDARVARMSIMRQVQVTVGTLALVGSGLAWFVHPAFVAVPAGLGAGLVFAGVTGTCALAAVLGRMPWNAAGRAEVGGGACGV